MKGQIIRIISDLYTVKTEEGKIPCKCRGIFRKMHITPLVGDYVIITPEKKVIEQILPRKSELYRPKVANINQAFIITSLKEPNFDENLLDKLILLMEIHNIKPIICVTKKDLLNEEESERINKILDYYKKIGYTVLVNTEIDKIKKLISNNTSVFTGQTGAGKSTLLNKINPDWNLETSEISHALGRGKHTTRVVELFEVENGQIMDTPGFSSLEFENIPKEQIKEGFVEFSKFPCEFKDCSHTKEHECSVKKAVIDNNILETRYENYLKIYQSR